MAEAECARIVAEAEARWQVAVALQHRIGALEIGDAAVAVAVAASAHRDEAFAACRYVIEEVKRRVPIWKREYYADGTVDWVDPTGGAAACLSDADRRARPPAPQPPDLGHRPLQHAVPLLHAGGGVRLAAARVDPHLRGARPARRASSPASASTRSGSPAASRCCATTCRRWSRCCARHRGMRRPRAHHQRHPARAGGGRAPRGRTPSGDGEPRHAPARADAGVRPERAPRRRARGHRRGERGGLRRRSSSTRS